MTNLRIEKLQNNINLISDLDLNRRGWRLEVAKILNITPQAVKNWMLREMPETYKKCWQHKDNIK